MVSIITPTYNSSTYIAETIDSVLLQNYTNWEMLIVDDASVDDTCAIVEEYVTKDARIKLIKRSKNEGAGKARNIAIENATGTYIAFLDADDLWKPNKLKIQVSFMIKQKVSMCFSSYDLINENGDSLYKTINALPELDYEKLLKSNYVGNLTGIYNAKSLGKIYMPEIRKRQDWGLWLKVIKKSQIAKSVPDSLALYRVHKDGLSGNKINLIKHNFNFYRKALKFPFFKAVFHFIHFIFEQFFIKSQQTTTNHTTQQQ